MDTWKYNRFGHIEITGDGLDIYIQTDYDVAQFLESVGLNLMDVCVDDWGYFDGSEYRNLE